MAGRRRINRWLVLGIVVGVGVGLLGTWLVVLIDNRAVSATWSLLLLVVLISPLYPRRWRRRRSPPLFPVNVATCNGDSNQAWTRS